MANPQPEQFTRISNELYTAIMRTDFSKRQRKILDLVMRMSYGCGKKYALLRPVDFELVGIYKTHIGKELEYLVLAKVLFIQGNHISLNKNYEEWGVRVFKTANSERFKALIKANLESYQNSNLTVNTHEKVTETVTCGYQNSNHDSYQNSNLTANTPEEVTETVTDGYQNGNHESYQNSNLTANTPEKVTETVTCGYQNSNCESYQNSNLIAIPAEKVTETVTDGYQNSNLKTNTLEKVTETVTCGYQNSNQEAGGTESEVTKTVTKSYQNSNLGVTETVTEQDTHPNGGVALGPAERKVKDIKENIYTPPTPPVKLDDILVRFPRYSNGQLALIRKYWDMICLTRKTGKVADTIVAKEMNYWERFPAGIVMEALDIHMRKYPSKQEEYTAGIMRRLTQEKGGSANGTTGQVHKPFVIDRSKFLYKGGNYT